MRSIGGILVLLLAGCAMDGGSVISGREVNERIREAVVIKVASCYPGDSSAVLLYAEVSPRFDRGQFYSTRDIDRCIQDFNAVPCASFYSAFGRSAISLYLANVYAFVCSGISDKEFFSPRYFEGNFPESSSSRSSN